MSGKILASMVLMLKAEKTQDIPRCMGNILHWQLLQWIRAKSFTLSKRWHDGESSKSIQLKPFSLSPLFGKTARISTSKLIVKDHAYWLKIGFLDEAGYEVIADYLFPKASQRERIKIGELSFILEEVKLNEHPWAKVTTWEKLQELIETEPKDINIPLTFNFYFKSPTTFRRKNKNRIVPDPELVFGSLLDKWNAFGEVKLPEEFKQKFAEQLIISKINVRSCLYDELKPQPFIGFTGKCEYTLIKDEPEIIKVLKTLSELAIFSGVGQKTTMGMGMCRELGE